MQRAAAAATAIGDGFGVRRRSAKTCGTEWDGDVRLFPPRGTLSGGGGCSESNVLLFLLTRLPGLSSRTSFCLAFWGSKDQVGNLKM